MQEELNILDKENLKELRKLTSKFRETIKDRLAEHFKDHSSDQVVRIMVDWIDLDALVELDDRCAVAKRILGIKKNTKKDQ